MTFKHTDEGTICYTGALAIWMQNLDIWARSVKHPGMEQREQEIAWLVLHGHFAEVVSEFYLDKWDGSTLHGGKLKRAKAIELGGPSVDVVLRILDFFAEAVPIGNFHKHSKTWKKEAMARFEAQPRKVSFTRLSVLKA